MELSRAEHAIEAEDLLGQARFKRDDGQAHTQLCAEAKIHAMLAGVGEDVAEGLRLPRDEDEPRYETKDERPPSGHVVDEIKLPTTPTAGRPAEARAAGDDSDLPGPLRGRQ